MVLASRQRISAADGRSAGGQSGGDCRRRTRFVRFAPSGSAQIGGELGEEAGRAHAEGHVAVPSMPRTRLAVIEAQIIFGALEAFLDGPAQAGGGRQLGKRRTPLARRRSNRRVDLGLDDCAGSAPIARIPGHAPRRVGSGPSRRGGGLWCPRRSDVPPTATARVGRPWWAASVRARCGASLGCPYRGRYG